MPQCTICYRVEPMERYRGRTAETGAESEETPAFLNDEGGTEVELLTDGGDE